MEIKAAALQLRESRKVIPCYDAASSELDRTSFHNHFSGADSTGQRHNNAMLQAGFFLVAGCRLKTEIVRTYFPSFIPFGFNAAQRKRRCLPHHT
jgi:hypothetical protein